MKASFIPTQNSALKPQDSLQIITDRKSAGEMGWRRLDPLDHAEHPPTKPIREMLIFTKNSEGQGPLISQFHFNQTHGLQSLRGRIG